MRSLRTILLPLLLAALPFAPAARAFSSLDLVTTFAGCVGRFSALMEHQWLFSDPGADQTEAERDAMVSLMDAILTETDTRQAMHVRLMSKAAHTQLLRRAVFNEDTEDATWALMRAEAEIGQCRALMLN
ncbi:hypothetical protein [Nioella aestuarii]|uniref:hypothetical protein n=1 Tax=Nioella aestuarii TaxID=1662864 RepID=UPI003D7FA0EA